MQINSAGLTEFNRLLKMLNKKLNNESYNTAYFKNPAKNDLRLYFLAVNTYNLLIFNNKKDINLIRNLQKIRIMR